ncbi:MAG: SdrD B-like domain-containing protein, partial [Desulfurococcaceae archaeon]
MYSKKFLSTIPLLLIAISMILPINIISLASTQELFDLQVQTGGKAGTTLSAYVTASTIHLTIHNWEIGKTANATEVYLSEENPEATVEYTVKVAKTTTYSYYIEGYVCVENGGDRSTQGLTIMLDIYAEPPWSNQIINDYPVDVSSHPVLHPGQEYCYGFIVPLNGFESYDEFKITANVTILNHSGHLGVPYGPTPSTTIHTITYQVSGYNCITVVDTNGYTWYTCESGRWIYDLTFEYDPKMGGSYEHVNTATIYETGQSASWTVIVSQVIKIMEFATISGIVFWDNNYNGEFNQGADKPIMGVPIELYKYDEEGGWIYEGTAYSGSDGYYYFYNIELGYQYKVVASKPVCEFCDKVISTTPMNYEINVEEAKTYDKNDFGFVCLKMLTGAKSKGYWSWSQYNKRTG